MRLISFHTRGSVARSDILSLKQRYYGPKRDILNYRGTSIFGLLSYYILSMDKGLWDLNNGYR